MSEELRKLLAEVIEENTGDAPMALTYIRVRAYTQIAVRAYFVEGGFDEPRDFLIEVTRTEVVVFEEVEFDTWPAYPPHPNWQGIETGEV